MTDIMMMTRYSKTLPWIIKYSVNGWEKRGAINSATETKLPYSARFKYNFVFVRRQLVGGSYVDRDAPQNHRNTYRLIARWWGRARLSPHITVIQLFLNGTRETWKFCITDLFSSPVVFQFIHFSFYATNLLKGLSIFEIVQFMVYIGA